MEKKVELGVSGLDGWVAVDFLGMQAKISDACGRIDALAAQAKVAEGREEQARVAYEFQLDRPDHPVDDVVGELLRASADHARAQSKAVAARRELRLARAQFEKMVFGMKIEVLAAVGLDFQPRVSDLEEEGDDASTSSPGESED